MGTGNKILTSTANYRDIKASATEIEAATYYEENFVPTLFEPWAPVIIDTAEIAPRHRVLDVACGSGVVTRHIASLTENRERPSGIDISAGMIEIARSISPEIDWEIGDALSLPYAENQFDRVVCQFGLMFFTDRVQALREMVRVLKPDGRLAVSVWNSLDNNPGFATKVDILQEIAGSQAADALRAPFCLGSPAVLKQICNEAGLRNFELATHTGKACFEDLKEFVDAELRGWLPIMNVHLNEPEIESIYQACRCQLGHYNSNSGRFTMPTSAHIFTGY